MKLPKVSSKVKASLLTLLVVVAFGLLLLFIITYPEKAIGILVLGIIVALIGYFVLNIYKVILPLVRKYESLRKGS